MTEPVGQTAWSDQASDPFNLDALERRAVEVISRTYDVRTGDRTERFWIQKGIEGMRCAVAEAKEKSDGTT